MSTTFLDPHPSHTDDGRVPSPVPVPTEVTVRPGPGLLSGIEHGPSLHAHREQYGDLPRLDAESLQDTVNKVRLRGRGGAAFPFATKLETVAKGSRPVLVVNMSEGEPASSKDAALALTRPHLVLDGAVATARALRARELHVVLPGERPAAATAMRTAIAERDDPVPLHTHVASQRFVAGQARAVVELIAGRPNLPVTTWAPEAISGLRGRPTLLSNAETWARVGLLVLRGLRAYTALGTRDEPGATLLTLSRPGSIPVVREAEYGERLRSFVPAERHGRPALVGGFHGAWATWPTLASARVSVNLPAQLDRERVEPVALNEADTGCRRAEARHVGTRDRERVGTGVGGPHRRVGQRSDEREREGTRTGAQIGDRVGRQPGRPGIGFPDAGLRGARLRRWRLGPRLRSPDAGSGRGDPPSGRSRGTTSSRARTATALPRGGARSSCRPDAPPAP